MTKAETIFWTYFKGTEEEKSAWQLANAQYLCGDNRPDESAGLCESEFRVVDPADTALSLVIDDMPSHVLVKADGEADVKWFDARLQKHVRKSIADPVSVTYNKFGKTKRKTWMKEDGTLTEKEFNQ